MAIHNYEELGENLRKILNRLLANDDLIRLLYYPVQDPLSQLALTQEEKEKKIFNKLIKLVPYIGQSETEQSILALVVYSGTTIKTNNSFKDLTLEVLSIHPLTTFFIASDNLRPFAIMGQVQKTLDGKTVNGLGRLEGGDFVLKQVTDDVCIYSQTFLITAYD